MVQPARWAVYLIRNRSAHTANDFFGVCFKNGHQLAQKGGLDNDVVIEEHNRWKYRREFDPASNYDELVIDAR